MARSVLAGGVLCLLLAVAAGAQQISGDAAAWAEVQASFERLGKLRSYRARITAPGQTAVALNEVVPPDRIRVVQQVANLTIEFITVGTESRMRIYAGGTPPPWRCVPPAQAAALRPQQSAAPEAVTIARLGEVLIDGVRTQGYQYTLVVQGRPATQRAYILADGGLPRRVEAVDGANVTAVVDYYDFNVPLTIELPRCTG